MKQVFSYKMIKLTGHFLYYSIAGNVVITSVLLLLHINITRANLPLGFLAAAAVFYRLEKRELSLQSMCGCLVLGMAFFLLAVLAATGIYDIAYDGNLYHKFAAGLLRMGWNPVYEEAGVYIGQLRIPDKSLSYSDIWTACYPKASWYYGASVYCWSGNVESGKVMNLLLWASSVTVGADYLERHFTERKAMLLAGAAMSFPAAVAQCFTYYVDGMLGMTLFCTVFMLLKLTEYKPGEGRKATLLLLSGSIVICGNLKLTGLCFAGVFCIAFYAAWLWEAWRRKEPAGLRDVRRMFWLLAGSAAVTAGVVGAGTYITNLLRYGNPFYPYLGSGLLDLNNSLQNVGLADASPLRQMLSMIFVRTNSSDAAGWLEWKLPFTFRLHEIQSCTQDVIRGGAGVFFGGILLVTAFVLPYFLGKLWKTDREWVKSMLLVSSVSVLLVMIMPAGGQARYSPYLYLPPLCGLLAMMKYGARCPGKRGGVKLGCAAFLLLILVNAAAFTEYWVRGVRETASYRRDYAAMREAGAVRIDTPLPGLVFNLRDQGIRYEYADTGKMEHAMKYYYLEYRLGE